MATKKSRKKTPEQWRAYAKKINQKIYFSTVKQKLPNNRGYYVQRVESFYDPAIHGTQRITKTTIGKLPPGETDIGKMVPTDKKYSRKKIDAGKAMQTEGIVKDPRRWSCVQYALDIVLLVIVLAQLMGFNSCYAIAEFWKAQRKNLSKFIKDFPDSDISHDTVRRVFKIVGDSGVDFVKRVTEPLAQKLSRKLIAIDGQAVRAAGKKGAPTQYVLNVFSCDEELCLHQIHIGEKDNEITHAIASLTGLPLKGAIITCDAMNTQKAFCDFIISQGADYCMALKKNHLHLYEEVQVWFQKCKVAERAIKKICVERAHGREEWRSYRVLPANVNKLLLGMFQEWTGLEDGCVIEAVTERIDTKTGKVISRDARYFISSLHYEERYIAETAARAIRGHWAIENKLHWCLDITLNQDRTQCLNADFLKGKTSLNKIVYNILSKAQADIEAETGKKAISKPALKAKLSDLEYAIKLVFDMFNRVDLDEK